MVNSAVVSGGSNLPGVYTYFYLLRSSHSHSLRFLPHELLTTNSFLTATRILLIPRVPETGDSAETKWGESK